MGRFRDLITDKVAESPAPAAPAAPEPVAAPSVAATPVSKPKAPAVKVSPAEELKLTE